MPQMGYDMHEGTLVRWLKSEDSEVSLGEPIAEIETDKAVVEVEATAAGLLRKILAAEGDTVPVGEPIAIIGEAGEDIAGLLGSDPAPPAAEADEEPAPEPTPEVAETEEETTGIPLPPPADEPEQPAAEAADETDHDLRASPVARRLAAERGIDLSLITGTGPGNRITRDDVLWYKPPEDEYEAAEAEPVEPEADEPEMAAEAVDEEPAEPAMEAEDADEVPAEAAMEAETADEEPATEDEAADEVPAEPTTEDEAADEQPAEPTTEDEAADEVPAEPAMEAEDADEEPAEPVMEVETADEEPAEAAMEAETADEQPAEPVEGAEVADEETAEAAMEDEAADEETAEPIEEAEPAEEQAKPVMEAEPEAEEPAEAEAEPEEEEAPSNVIPLSRTRQQIARVTSRSKQEIPHFYVSAEIDMTQAMEMRRQLNSRLDDDSRVSVNDLVVKASVDALEQFPSFNASYTDDGIVMHDDVNVGLAIAQDDGLIVPALLDCAGKSLVELAAASKDLARRAGSGALAAQEYAGATFAISNMGMFGVSSFVAIIQPPQSAILAVGAVATQAVIRDDDIVAADMMTATLSADHRVVDGADGARFIGEIKRILENPFTLLL